LNKVAVAGAFDLVADRPSKTKKAFSNGTDGEQDIAHGHDDCALLGGVMAMDF